MLSIKFSVMVARIALRMFPLLWVLKYWVVIMPVFSESLMNRPISRPTSVLPELIVVSVASFVKCFIIIMLVVPNSNRRTSDVVSGMENKTTPRSTGLSARLVEWSATVTSHSFFTTNSNRYSNRSPQCDTRQKIRGKVLILLKTVKH